MLKIWREYIRFMGSKNSTDLDVSQKNLGFSITPFDWRCVLMVSNMIELNSRKVFHPVMYTCHGGTKETSGVGFQKWSYLPRGTAHHAWVTLSVFGRSQAYNSPIGQPLAFIRVLVNVVKEFIHRIAEADRWELSMGISDRTDASKLCNNWWDSYQ